MVVYLLTRILHVLQVSQISLFPNATRRLQIYKTSLARIDQEARVTGSKGGKPGQWSARKAQLTASEYKKAGGGYKGGEGKSQKSLKKWGKEDWQTKERV